MFAEGIEHTKLGEGLAQVSEAERELGLQCREPVREDEQSKVIVDQNGSPDEHQDEVIGQLIEEIAVIDLTDQQLQLGQQCQENGCPITTSFCSSGERRCQVTDLQLQHGQQSQEQIQEEQSSLVVDYQNGSPEPQYEQQDEVNGEKSQNQMQVTEVIVAGQTCKVIEEPRIEVTEQHREYGPQSQEEQHGKMVDDENGSPIEQQGEVNGHQIQIQLQEFIVEIQNVAPEKYEVTEQQTEHGHQSQEPIQEQNSKVIDYQNGLSKQQNEQKYEVNGQKSQNQIQVNTEIVENHNVAEQTYEVTEQQRDHGQQSQEEQKSKVIDCQDGSPEQQNEQQDGVNGHQVQNQMQEIVVSVEKQIDAKLKYKAPEDQIEEQSQSKEQEGEVTEEHIEGIKRQIQFQEEVVEVINNLTRPEAHQIENVSELQEQIELLSKIFNSGMQESFSKKQEKAAAIAVNSNPPLTSQKLPYHGLSTFSRENCIELLRMTHKLQEKTHKVQESLLDLLTTRELSQTTPKPILDLEERPMLMAGSCGEREYIECQEQQPRDPVQEKSMKCDRKAVELSCQTQTQEPAQQRQLHPRGQRQPKSKSLLTTSVVELSPRRNQDTQLLNIRETEKRQKLKISAEETGQTQLQQRQLRLRGKFLSESMTESLPSEHHYEQPQERKHQSLGGITKLNSHNEHNGELQPPKHPEKPHKPRGRPPKRKLNAAATEDVSLPAKYQKLQEEPENQRQGRPPKLDAKIVLGLLAASQSEPALSMTKSPLLKLNPGNEHDDELQPPKHPEQPQKRRGRPRKLNPDNELVKNCSPQSNLSSHKSEGEEPPKFNPDNEHHDDLQAPRLPEHSQKRRGRPRKSNPDNELVKNCSPQSNLSSHKSEGEEPPKFNPDNEHHDDLQAPRLPEHSQKRRGRPRKSNPDNELVKNCSHQSNLSSHKSGGEEPPKFNPDNEHHDDLQAPRFPEHPQKRRGREEEPELDTVATEDVQLPAKYQKLQEEPENQRQSRRPKLDAKIVLGLFAASQSEPALSMTEPLLLKLIPDNEYNDELQPPKHPEQPPKRRGRPRKLNPDNEVVKNCSPQSNLSSHKSGEKWPPKLNPDNEHHDELQLPKQPEQPQNPKRRGRPRKLISERTEARKESEGNASKQATEGT